jgi:hypothetical protein
MRGLGKIPSQISLPCLRGRNEPVDVPRRAERLREKESVVQARFEIVWQPSPAEAPIVLRSAVDANEATMAFHEELVCLRSQEATGELFIRKGDRARHSLVRQPLKNHRVRHPLVRPPLTDHDG